MSKGVLAIIPCLNEEEYLEPLVRRLVTAGSAAPMRIVIADGGSKDRTRAIAQNLTRQYAGVSFLDNPSRIQAAAINLAVETFKNDAELIIRLDAHADYPDDYCCTLVDEVEKTGAASVVTAMTTSGKSWFQKAVAAAQNSKLGNGGAAHRNAGKEGMWVDHGHHALIQMNAFRAVGGYDESFSHNEDAELDIRLRRAGYKIWLSGNTSLIYFPRSSPSALFRQYVQFGRGRARTILKHRTRPRLRQLAPAAVLPAAPLALFTPIWPIAALPLAIWALFCLGYGLALALKAKNPALLASGPAAMIMHSGWSIGFWTSILHYPPQAVGDDAGPAFVEMPSNK
jgi:succinoglycan biosynthesis protein ExoA